MGTFWVDVEIGDPGSTGFETVTALVDTGATYTVMPASLLRSLGVAPVDRQSFILANGQRIHRDIGETAIRIDGRIRTTLVVFSEEESHALCLARTHWRRLVLRADPVNQSVSGTCGRAGWLGTQVWEWVSRLLNYQSVSIEGDGAVAEAERGVSKAAQEHFELVQPAGDVGFQLS